MKASDLLLVNHEGDVVVGDMPLNRAAFVLHSAVHKARPKSLPLRTPIRRTARPSLRSAFLLRQSPRLLRVLRRPSRHLRARWQSRS